MLRTYAEKYIYVDCVDERLLVSVVSLSNYIQYLHINRFINYVEYINSSYLDLIDDARTHSGQILTK